MAGQLTFRNRLVRNGLSSEEEDEDPGTATSLLTLPDFSNTVWTDEKHSQYLNSIEEEFVDQLYNRYRHSSVPKYKVQRRDCWDEMKFKTTPTETRVLNESRTPSGCHLCETSSNDVPASSSSSSTVYHHYFAGSRSNNTGEGSDQKFMDDDGQVENKRDA
ncbi:hypothetical protein ZOSMA_70G00690 [Zostera marina]|uniref:Uncharacterized protein n=1 Tax=Zostera marina TaxID=29655 RepID=A0A0K9NSV0_ZOSMR|nr:hypothetical protein ZOSMA_70G00690 [Zostera marina]